MGRAPYKSAKEGSGHSFKHFSPKVCTSQTHTSLQQLNSQNCTITMVPGIQHLMHNGNHCNKFRIPCVWFEFVALGGLHVEDNVQAAQEHHDIKENNQQPVQLQIHKKWTHAWVSIRPDVHEASQDNSTFWCQLCRFLAKVSHALTSSGLGLSMAHAPFSQKRSWEALQ